MPKRSETGIPNDCFYVVVCNDIGGRDVFSFPAPSPQRNLADARATRAFRNAECCDAGHTILRCDVRRVK